MMQKRCFSSENYGGEGEEAPDYDNENSEEVHINTYSGVEGSESGEWLNAEEINAVKEKLESYGPI